MSFYNSDRNRITQCPHCGGSQFRAVTFQGYATWGDPNIVSPGLSTVPYPFEAIVCMCGHIVDVPHRVRSPEYRRFRQTVADTQTETEEQQKRLEEWAGRFATVEEARECRERIRQLEKLFFGAREK